ncbi:MAG TPA: TetR/AcrR family transcriptional regulator [Symbiobacteriaceae bacterium]|nr:TetR/AcrR family transcriptional regulator [Symbiobacteriaceae bacterium]
MARPVNEQAYAAKYNEILDAAQRLMLSKGYERMTVQDITAAVGMSSGAFHHYFRSKPAVLEALVKRMIDAMEQMFVSIMNDQTLRPLDKLNHFFATLGRYKLSQKAVMLSMLRVWYNDDNALLRSKLRTAMLTRLGGPLGVVIGQGAREGVFAVADPERAGEVVLSLSQDLVDAMSHLLLSVKADHEILQQIEHTVAAYTVAIERVLGAPNASLTVADLETLRESVTYLTQSLKGE